MTCEDITSSALEKDAHHWYDLTAAITHSTVAITCLVVFKSVRCTRADINEGQL